MQVALPRPAEPKVLSTGIPNLDYILYGGFHGIGSRAPSVLIRGSPGSGKSLLCLTMAAEVFHAGQSVIYFTLEQRPEDLQALMAQFTWGSGIVPVIDRARAPKLSLDGAGLHFVFSQFTLSLSAAISGDIKLAASAFREFLRDRVATVLDGRPGLIVIDSLPDAVREHVTKDADGLTFDMQRSLMLGLTQLGVDSNSPILIALETSADAEWRDYVVDAVLHLERFRSARHLEAPEAPHHFLEVRKVRNQGMIPGRHRVRILPRTGICVYPDPAGVVFRMTSEASAPLPSGKASDRMVVFCARPDMDAFLKSGWQAGTSQSSLIREGSATLLYGADRTRKNAIAAGFLREGLRDALPGDNTEVLYLVSGTGVKIAEDILRAYWTILLPETERAQIESYLARTKCVAIDGFTDDPNVILKRILLRFPNDKPKPARVVLDDVSALNDGSEVIRMLKTIFDAQQVTSLFVHTVRTDEESEFRGLFDNLIRTRHLLLPDQATTRVAYTLEKFRGVTPMTHSWELFTDPDTGALSLRDSFRDFIEGPDHRLRSLPLEMRLYKPFDDLEEACYAVISAVFGAQRLEDGADRDPEISVKFFGRFDADLIFESLRSLPEFSSLSKTQVICFDDPWVDELIERQKIEELGKLLPHVCTNQFNEEVLKAVSKESKSSPGTHLLYGLPQHIDFGFYIVHRKLLEELPDWRTKSLSWDDLADQALRSANSIWQSLLNQKIPETAREHLGAAIEGNRGPHFDMSSNDIEESFLCFFLEVLKPFLNLEAKDLGFRSQEVKDAVVDLWLQLDAMNGLPGPSWRTAPSRYLKPEDRRALDEPPAAQYTALVQRHWYVSYRRLIRAFPEVEHEYRIVFPPIFKDKPDKPAEALKGDWFLGVVKGSPNPMRGAWAISSLAAEQAASHAIHARGLGLPPHEVLLKDNVNQKIMMPLYEQSWSRRQIKGYHGIRLVLLNGLSAIYREFRKKVWSGDRSQLKEVVTGPIEELVEALGQEIEARRTARPQ